MMGATWVSMESPAYGAAKKASRLQSAGHTQALHESVPARPSSTGH